MKTLLNKKTAATLALCLSMSMSTFGQSQVIHLSQNKATVSSIIKAIEKQTQMSEFTHALYVIVVIESR